MSHNFVLTGGGTGGHVYPALAVAQVLRERDHKLLYIGTREGLEARIVPEHELDMAFVRSGGLNRVGRVQQLRSAAAVASGVSEAHKILAQFRPAAVFSMGGYVAGPVMAAAILARIPLVIMEPNAIPGAANRLVAKRVYRALLGFESTRRWFLPERSEVTGLPVRPAFFEVQAKSSGAFTVLVTGGLRGSRTLNRAVRDARPLLADVRIIHQTGGNEFKDFEGVADTVPFISDMPQAFAETDLVVARSGAGSVNELAAAGMPSILVPFPFAADNHQLKNAETLQDAGAARVILDTECTGVRLASEIEALRQNPDILARMRQQVRQFARAGAAERAAEVLEAAASRSALSK